MSLLRSTLNDIEPFIGDDSWIDQRITGNVRVVDQATDKTIAGKQFFASSTKLAGGAAFYIAAVKAVGVPVSVRRLTVSSSVAGLMAVGFATADPTVAFFAGSALQNKLAGGAVSGAVRVFGECAAATPTGIELPGFVALAYVYVNANAYQELLMTTPLYLPVGRLLCAVGPAANASVTMMTDCEE